MDNKRVVGWLAFFGVAAALTWLPPYFMPAEEGEVVLSDIAPAGKTKTASQRAAKAGQDAAAPIKDLSPAGDLFAARSWKPAPTLATVTEQPINPTPVAQTPSLPPVPFQFIGKIDDRRDLQVFLQNGEKIYVVRSGDVIDDTWRLERISDLELSLVYLPLHVSQTLSVGSAP